MRLSLDGRRFIYVAGKAQASPVVTLHDVDGVEVALAPGHSPRWSDATSAVVFGPHADGPPLQFALAPRWAVDSLHLPSGNSVAAAAGRVAVHRTDPRRILSNFRAPIDGATDPALSDDGEWLAYLRPDEPAPGVSSLWVERAVLGTSRRRLAVGAVRNLRFGSRTLVWEAGGGRIGGCADVANLALDPVEAFLLPAAWRCYDPVPVWVPGGSALLVLFNADDGSAGHKRIAEWGSLAAGTPVGWVPVRLTPDGPRGDISSGSGYEHDARPVDGGPTVLVVGLDPLGVPEAMTIDVRAPRVPLVPPVKPEPPPLPPVLPDIPWQTDPNGVIEDISEWLFDPNQGPDVHIGRGIDGRRVRFFCKSDEGSGDGRGQYIAEHWDEYDAYIGHLEDASTGRRIFEGRDVTAEDIVRMFPTDHARVWAGLKLQRNWFVGDRLWMPRRLVSGTRIRYRTDITWTVPPRETPTTNVWRNITIDIHIDVGYGRYKGREVRARVAYIPNGNPEINYYGEPNGQNAWVIAAGNSDPWSEQRSRQIAGLLSAPAASRDPRAFVRFRAGSAA